MTTKKKSSRDGYPYPILPFRGTLSKREAPLYVNEYFLIEALLRSAPVMAVYRQGGEHAVVTKFRQYGINGQNPLRGTHHALLSEPGADKEWGEKMAQLGYVDAGLGILNLGTIATLPPRMKVDHGHQTFYGPLDGFADCKWYLQANNPRFLCLRIDTRSSTEAIIAKLRAVLRERHKQTLKGPSSKVFAFYDALKKTSFRNIYTWLEYFQCYDLFRNGDTMEAAGRHVYGRSYIWSEKANMAIRRVKFLIAYAEQVAHEQEHATKARIKQPAQPRTLWPPHHIP